MPRGVPAALRDPSSDEVVGDRVDVAIRTARKSRPCSRRAEVLPREIDGDGVLSLHIVKAGEDQGGRKSPRRQRTSWRRARALEAYGPIREIQPLWTEVLILSGSPDPGCAKHPKRRLQQHSHARRPVNRFNHSHRSGILYPLGGAPARGRPWLVPGHRQISPVSAVDWTRRAPRPGRRRRTGVQARAGRPRPAGARSGSEAAADSGSAKSGPAPAQRARHGGARLVGTPVHDGDRQEGRAMPRQFCQRWNWLRLSAPITQTKCTAGTTHDRSRRPCRRYSGF